jgi:hypothetical protein
MEKLQRFDYQPKMPNTKVGEKDKDTDQNLIKTAKATGITVRKLTNC